MRADLLAEGLFEFNACWARYDTVRGSEGDLDELKA
jgi:hypothetical protein